MEAENNIRFDVITEVSGSVNRMTEERRPKKMHDWVTLKMRRRIRIVVTEGFLRN